MEIRTVLVLWMFLVADLEVGRKVRQIHTHSTCVFITVALRGVICARGKHLVPDIAVN